MLAVRGTSWESARFSFWLEACGEGKVAAPLQRRKNKTTKQKKSSQGYIEELSSSSCEGEQKKKSLLTMAANAGRRPAGNAGRRPAGDAELKAPGAVRTRRQRHRINQSGVTLKQLT